MIWVVSGAGVDGGMERLRNAIVAMVAVHPAQPYASTMNGMAKVTLRAARRICVAVMGGTVLLVGVIMLVTPGPAMLVIPAGLAILALEFQFAALWLRKLKEGGKRMLDGVRSGSSDQMANKNRSD